MSKFDIGGMNCAACSARIEKAVSSLDGVEECSVNLLTNSMQTKGTCPDDKIIKAVENAGYTATVRGEKNISTPKKENDTKKIVARLLSSLFFLAVLMYISMGHIMWGWYLPEYLADNPLSLGLLQLILSAAVLVINQKFFISGFKALLNKSPNMDTLVSLGSGASFIYSVCVLFIMNHHALNGNTVHISHYLHGMYFESAAMILALITVGKMLESYSKGKTTNALSELMNLAPGKAILVKDGIEVAVNASDLKPGDIIAVRPGESFAADGVVTEGESSVDESALTGESIPADKGPGDRVRTATVNKSGFLKVRLTHTGDDTILSGIIKMVSDASATKAPIARIADKVSGVFVPFVIAIAVLSFAAWLVEGESIGFALARGISVLVISCPCALGLATPVAIMVSTGKGARNGILFKNASAIETIGKGKIVVFDKTGTLTKGMPEVTDIRCISAADENELLKLAYSLEQKSEHPLSRAICQKAEQKGISACEVSGFAAVAGSGLTAVYGGKKIFGGNLDYIKSECREFPADIEKTNKELASSGKTTMYFADKEKLYGIIAVADTVKPESRETVERLHKMGLKTVMLTGDNEFTAKKIASELGIDTVISGVLPDEKAKNIVNLKKQGTVIMVGDGINDAPSLISADVGIAVAKGTDIAMDAANVVLMKDSLSYVPSAISLGRHTMKNIKQNLFWAFIYNALGIPLAAGAFIKLFSWQLTPMFGAAAMSLSSFCVVTNALRLNCAKIHSGYFPELKKGKEEKNMQKTIKIEGMMCPHCEARVKNLLEEVDGVTSAVTNHKDGTAVMELSKEIDNCVFEKIITDAGYKFIS